MIKGGILWMMFKIDFGYKSLTIRTQVYIMKRLRKYPFVIFIAYSFPSIHRILLDLRINSLTLNIFHKISVHSGGIILFLVFISSKYVRSVNQEYINWCINKIRGIFMTTEQQKEKTLGKTVRFDSDDDENLSDRVSTSDSNKTLYSQTTSVMIDWLNTPKKTAVSKTAVAAYGEMGVELSQKETHNRESTSANSNSHTAL